MAGLGRRSHYRKHLTDAVLHDLPEPDGATQRIARVVGTRGGNMFDVVVAPPSSSSTTSTSPGAANDDDDDASRSKGEEDTTTTAPKGSTGDENVGAGGEPRSMRPRSPQLAFLPTKFRKLVWIKRNDFVIVECGDEEEEEEEGEEGTTRQKKSDQKEGGGFRYVISHILYKDQVKHVKSRGLWPPDPFFADEEHSSSGAEMQQGLIRKNLARNDGEDGEEDFSPDGGDGEGSEPQREGYEDNGIVFEDPLGDDFMVNTNRLATLCVEDSSSEEEDSD